MVRLFPLVSLTCMLVAMAASQQNCTVLHSHPPIFQPQKKELKVAMERVLEQNEKALLITDLLKRTAAMQRIDTSACPPQFRSAYLDHVYAWEYLAQVDRARQQLEHDGFIQEALVRVLLGVAVSPQAADLSELLLDRNQLDRLKQGASKKLGEVDHVVEKIALEYGVLLNAAPVPATFDQQDAFDRATHAMPARETPCVRSRLPSRQHIHLSQHQGDQSARS